MKTHLTSTQAELDRMKAELDAAVKHDAELIDKYCVPRLGSGLTFASLEALFHDIKKAREEAEDTFKSREDDPVVDAYFKYQEPHHRVPPPLEVWRAAWLAAEAHFQEKHKYQLVCCPKCDHEFEYEPDLT